MDETAVALVQPLAYRVWEPKHYSYFYTDVQPPTAEFLERWTGLFDKQGRPLYEGDIVRVHYDWKFGWVRALVVRQGKTNQYIAQATTVDGMVLHVGHYCFADSYRLGNLREHPNKLVAAKPQFTGENAEPWWLSKAIFHSLPERCHN